MAKTYFYLRPSADISVGHILVPAESTNAYSLINEEVNDGATTTIGITVAPGETKTATSSFKMSGTRPSDARNIIDANVIISKTSLQSSDISSKITAIINGESFELSYVPSEYLTISFYSSQSFINAMKSYNESTDISLTLEHSGTVSSDAKLNSSCIITQVYIEVTYNNGILRKVNNDWKGSHAVYRKVNGIWESIENGYETVGSRLSKSGHHQEYLPAVIPTCTETGLTEGYKCVVCGKNIRPQEITPANGHNYIKSGGYNVCEVCNHIEGLGFVELAYHGTATALSQARYNLATTTVGNYALFGGAISGSSSNIIGHTTVDAYDTSLTRTIPTALSVGRGGLAATTVGNYALFGGGLGSYSNGNNPLSTVDAYDTSLTRTTATVLSQARYDLTATTVGNYALFGGGTDGGSTYSTVDAYDTSLTRTTATALSQARSDLAATTVGNYALFGGGSKGSSVYGVVDAYDTSLTQTTVTELSEERYYLAATTVGNYALFSGGSKSSYGTGNVDAYDTSLTQSKVTSTEMLSSCAATTLGMYALFGGGRIVSGSGNYSSVVYVYDTSLTQTKATDLSQARYDLAATTVGNYVLFSGGKQGSNTYYSTVDAYKLQPISG